MSTVSTTTQQSNVNAHNKEANFTDRFTRVMGPSKEQRNRDSMNRLKNLIMAGMLGGLALGAGSIYFHKDKKLKEEEDKEDIFKDPKKFTIRPAKANPPSPKFSHLKGSSAASVFVPVAAGLATLGGTYVALQRYFQKLERRELKDRLRRAQQVFAHGAYGVEPPKPELKSEKERDTDKEETFDVEAPTTDDARPKYASSGAVGTQGLSAGQLATSLLFGAPIALFAAALMASRGTLNHQFPKAEIRRPDAGPQFQSRPADEKDEDDTPSNKKPSEMWYSSFIPTVPGLTTKRANENSAESKLAFRNIRNGLHEFWLNVIGSHRPLFEKSGYKDVVTASLVPGGVGQMEKAARDLGVEGVFSVSKEICHSNPHIKLSKENFRPAVSRLANSGSLGGALYPNTVAEAMHMSPTVSQAIFSNNPEDPDVRELHKMGCALAQIERERSATEWAKIAAENTDVTDSFSGHTLDEFMDDVFAKWANSRS